MREDTSSFQQLSELGKSRILSAPYFIHGIEQQRLKAAVQFSNIWLNNYWQELVFLSLPQSYPERQNESEDEGNVLRQTFMSLSKPFLHSLHTENPHHLSQLALESMKTGVMEVTRVAVTSEA